MERFPSKSSLNSPIGNRFGPFNDDRDCLSVPRFGRITFGGRFCIRRHHLAPGRRGSASGHSKFAGASQNYCHPRRRKSGKRRYFVHLVPFRSGRRDNWRVLPGAGELAISLCCRWRHLCWSRRGLAHRPTAKALGRSACANIIFPAYAVRGLLQWRKSPCFRNPRCRNCRHLYRVARPADLERAHAPAGLPCMGNGHFHFERNTFHAHRPPTAAGYGRAGSGNSDSRGLAGDRVCRSDRAGSFRLGVRSHLFAASAESNVPR